MTDVDRRSAIIAAAWKLFTDFGYKATTIEQIARHASIGKGTFYNYFTTKEDVLFAIVEQAGSGMASLADTFLAEARAAHFSAGVDPVPGLVRSFLASVISLRTDYSLYRNLVMEAKAFGSPKVAEAVARLDSRFESELARILGDLSDCGIIAQCDRRITACVIVQSYSALIEMRDDAGKPLSAEEIARVLERILSGGLLKSKSENRG